MAPAHGVFAKYRAAVASASQGAVTIPNPPPAQTPATITAQETEKA
jgi:dihydroxy-acid dehydratase